jgi:iron complex transport system substrate-binding protein
MMQRCLFVLVALWLGLGATVYGESSPTTAAPRIVSLAPSVTETLFALGAGAQVTGVCSFCDFPQEAERLPRVGAYLTPNVESIIAQAPDVVIGVPPNNPDAIAALQRAGLHVVIVAVDTIAQVKNAIATMARAIGREDAGVRLWNDIERRMTTVQARLSGAPQRRVLMVVGQNPLIAVGSGTYLNELIVEAHGVNIAAATGVPWPQLSLEFAVANLPEVIIDGSMGSDEKAEGQRLGVWQNFPELPAIREKRLYLRRSAMLLRPGPRLAEGFEEIARFIHPECFQAPRDGVQAADSR